MKLLESLSIILQTPILTSNNLISIKSIFALSLILLSISGCSQLVSKPLSGEYIDGQKMAAIHAKQDAIDSHCINYPISINSNMINNIEKHISKLKEDRKDTDFINGFSKSYQDEYREYMSLYCDNFDSSEEYIKP